MCLCDNEWNPWSSSLFAMFLTTQPQDVQWGTWGTVGKGQKRGRSLKGVGFEMSNAEVVRRKGPWRMMRPNEERVWLEFSKFVLVVGCHVGWWRVMKCDVVVSFVVFDLSFVWSFGFYPAVFGDINSICVSWNNCWLAHWRWEMP